MEIFHFLMLTTVFQPLVLAVAPNINYSNNMRILKLPKDTKVGSIIYRLKGYDPDPDVLTFGVVGSKAKQLLDIRSVSFTEADVILKSKPAEKEYQIQLYVTDGLETTQVESTIIITETWNHPSPFLEYPLTIILPENSPVNISIGDVIAKDREDSNLAVKFELRGSDNFAIRYIFGPRGTSRAEIILVKTVDYERKNLYPLKVVAMYAWRNESIDTRNIAAVDIIVIVSDVQDSPPIFTHVPTVVRLLENSKQGDKIFYVKAEDGDFGNPRNVTYELSEGSQWKEFFNVNRVTGDVRLSQSISELQKALAGFAPSPLILTLKAKEIGPVSGFPAMSKEVEVVLVLTNTENHPPYFHSIFYLGSIEENSPALTAIKWDPSVIAKVTDNDQGKNGMFQLLLQGSDSTFEIQPKQGFGEFPFSILVLIPSNLDYETSESKFITFEIVAKESESSNLFSAKVPAKVNIIDVNDNLPQFEQTIYVAYVREDAQPGTSVARVQATDLDSGNFGKVRYSIHGPISRNLLIDETSGVITLLSNAGLDRERIPEYSMTVEARDDLGLGNKNTVELVIHLTDSNDNSPVFSQPRYDAILNSDRKNFYDKLIVQAFDADEPGPNSNITYEILNGNYQEKFMINNVTGEISIREELTGFNQNQGYPDIVLSVRAHDQGIPARYSLVKVYIHSQEFLNRTINFILPMKESEVYLQSSAIERGLSILTGAKINPYAVRAFNSSSDRSVLQAWVAYPLTAIVNLTSVQDALIEMFGRSYQFSDAKEEKKVNQAQYDFVFWLLISIFILMLVLLMLLICYCCCYKAVVSKKITITPRKIEPKENGLFIKKFGYLDTDSRRKVAWNDNDSAKQPVWRFSKRVEDRRDQNGRVQLEEQNNLQDDPVADARRRTYDAGQHTNTDPDVTLRDVQGDRRQNVGYFVVKRKIRSDSISLDSRDHDFYDQRYEKDRPRRTEILYIQSPIREDSYFNRYPVPGMIPRSVSETALYQRANSNAENEQYYDSHQPSSQFHDHELPRRVRFPRYPPSTNINNTRNVENNYNIERMQAYENRSWFRAGLPRQQSVNNHQQREVYNNRQFSNIQGVPLSTLSPNPLSSVNNTSAEYEEVQNFEVPNDGFLYPERAHNNKVLSDHYQELSNDSCDAMVRNVHSSNNLNLGSSLSQIRSTDMQNQCNEHKMQQKSSLNAPKLNILNVSTLESDLTSLVNDGERHNERTAKPSGSRSPRVYEEQEVETMIGSERDAQIIVESPHSNSTPIEHIQKHLTESTIPEIYGNLVDEQKVPVEMVNESDEWKIHVQTRLQNGVVIHNEVPGEMQAEYDEDSDSEFGRGVGSFKLRRGNYLEKKSVFTIAYNGVQTRKLKSQDEKTFTP